jgi:hypothetical protein
LYYCRTETNGFYKWGGWVCGKYIDELDDNQIKIIKIIKIDGIACHPAFYFSEFPRGTVSGASYQDFIFNAIMEKVGGIDYINYTVNQSIKNEYFGVNSSLNQRRAMYLELDVKNFIDEYISDIRMLEYISRMRYDENKLHLFFGCFEVSDIKEIIIPESV